MNKNFQFRSITNNLNRNTLTFFTTLFEIQVRDRQLGIYLPCPRNHEINKNTCIDGQAGMNQLTTTMDISNAPGNI